MHHFSVVHDRAAAAATGCRPAIRRGAMSTRVTRFVVQALVALGVALIATAPAHATRWIGKWDPLYGSPFTTTDDPSFAYNLGWAGEVKVNAPCIVPSGGTITNGGPECTGIAVVESLTVFLYDFDQGPTAILNTLTFDAGSLTIAELRYNELGKLTGISTTGLSTPVEDTSAAFPSGSGTNAFFAVQFVLGGQPCFLCVGDDALFPPLPFEYDGPVLFAGTNGTCSDSGCVFESFYRNSTEEENRPQISFTPEPGSLALLALGLVAAGAASRRRGARG
jgi:hypothetical protein